MYKEGTHNGSSHYHPTQLENRNDNEKIPHYMIDFEMVHAY